VGELFALGLHPFRQLAEKILDLADCLPGVVCIVITGLMRIPEECDQAVALLIKGQDALDDLGRRGLGEAHDFFVGSKKTGFQRVHLLQRGRRVLAFFLQQVAFHQQQ